MKVLPGALVTQFSGSAGGQTIQNGRFGFIMRNKPIPTKTKTPSQQLVNGAYQVIVHTWGTLTAGQRAAWVATAPNWPFTDIFGNPFFLSGFGLYTKLNLGRVNIDLAQIVVPFDPEVVPQPASFSVTPNGAFTGFEMIYTPTPTDATVITEVFATRPLTTGTAVPGNAFKLIDLIPAGTASPFDTLTAYSDTFGFFPQSGETVFFRLLPVLFDRGQQGVPLDATLVLP